MQKEIILTVIISILISGCILDDGSNSSPAVVSANTQAVANQSNSTLQNDSASDVFNQTTDNQTGVLGQNDTNIKDVQNDTPTQNDSIAIDDSYDNVGQPELEQKITAEAYLDSELGRYSTKRCNVKLSPTKIEAGKTTTVSIYAYSPSNERVSFLCGEHEKLQGTGGLFQDDILCDFEQSGLTTVWLALDGYICASAPLRVYTPSTKYKKFCQIVDYTSSDESQGSSRHFEASVYISNYKSDDVLEWNCGKQKIKIPIDKLILSSEKTGFIKVSCDFRFDPGYVESMDVFAGSDYCGDVLEGLR